MKKLIVAVGLIGITILAQDAPKAPGQSANSTSSTPGERIRTPAIDSFNKASTVIGMPVEEPGGKIAGKVQDLVFDFETRKVAYAVLALGGNRVVPVPITALKRAQSGDHFVLNMTPALLAAAPGIQNDDWPAVDAFAVGAPAQSETGGGRSSNESGR